MFRLYTLLPFLLCAAVACHGADSLEQAPLLETADGEQLADDFPDDAEDFNLLVAVELDNGNVLEFYEPVPGQVLVMEHGVNGNPKTSLAGRTPMEVYHSATGGAAVPDALAEATQRAYEHWGGEVVFRGEVDKQADDVHKSGFDCTDPAQFTESFCAEAQSSYDVQLCLTNWWNGAWGQANYVNYHYGGLCPLTHREPVRFRMWVDGADDGPGWDLKASWLVYTGGWAQFSWVHHPENKFVFWLPPHLFCYLNTFHVHMKVDQASGKSFHFGFRSMNEDGWCNAGYVPMPGSGVDDPQPTGGL